MTDEWEAAARGLEAAWSAFGWATRPEDVDRAIYAMREAEERVRQAVFGPRERASECSP